MSKLPAHMMGSVEINTFLSTVFLFLLPLIKVKVNLICAALLRYYELLISQVLMYSTC